MSTLNPGRGPSLKWAWKLIDRHRNRDKIDSHRIALALKAIANVTGRSPKHGSPTYEFDDEATLRLKAAPR